MEGQEEPGARAWSRHLEVRQGLPRPPPHARPQSLQRSLVQEPQARGEAGQHFGGTCGAPGVRPGWVAVRAAPHPSEGACRTTRDCRRPEGEPRNSAGSEATQTLTKSQTVRTARTCGRRHAKRSSGAGRPSISGARGRGRGARGWRRGAGSRAGRSRGPEKSKRARGGGAGAGRGVPARQGRRMPSAAAPVLSHSAQPRWMPTRGPGSCSSASYSVRLTPGPFGRYKPGSAFRASASGSVP